jgi:hypothetical protein
VREWNGSVRSLPHSLTPSHPHTLPSMSRSRSRSRSRSIGLPAAPGSRRRHHHHYAYGAVGSDSPVHPHEGIIGLGMHAEDQHRAGLLGCVMRAGRPRRLRALGAVGVLVLAATSALLVLRELSSSSPSSHSADAAPALTLDSLAAAPKLSETSSGGVGFSVTNKYIDVMGPIGLEYPWTSDSYVVVDAGHPFTVTVTGTTGVVEVTLAGEPLDLDEQLSATLAAPGTHFLAELVVTDVASGAVATGTIASKVVRREFREMLPEDRELYLDSLKVMWDVGGEQGRQLYGANYVSSLELLMFHASNSANRVGDFFHMGQGFLAQHLKLDTLVEKSIIAIDSRNSLPYWDWTIDQDMYMSGEAPTVWAANPAMWSADGFGSVKMFDIAAAAGTDGSQALNVEEIEACRIFDGRWADTNVPSVDQDEGRLYPRNSFGLLRSPWNNNPSPYVTRFTAANADLPSCELTFPSVVEPGSLSEFMLGLEFRAHSAVHKAIGGAYYDEGTLDALQTMLASVADKVGGVMDDDGTCPRDGMNPMVYAKNAWRAYLLEWPETCDPQSKSWCRNSCDSETFDLAQLGRFSVKHCFNTDEDSAALAGEEALVAIGKALCEFEIFKGEHYEASGTSDPSFFVVHGALLRYYHYRQILSPLAGEWATGIDACEPANGLCYASQGQPIVDFEVCCAGHFEKSQYFTNSRLDATEGLTNSAILEFMDPLSPDTNYIFHHLQWGHCENAPDSGYVPLASS